MDSNQPNVSNNQSAGNTDGQTPVQTPESDTRAQTHGHTQLPEHVEQPQARRNVQTPSQVPASQTGTPGQTNSGGNGQTTVNRGNAQAMRVPQFAGQPVATDGNPTATEYANTHGTAQAGQTAQYMPQTAVNQTALAYSVLNAHQHGGSQAAAYGYMPQYAQYGYPPAYTPDQTQQMVPPQAYTSNGGPWGKPDVAGFSRSCNSLVPFDGRNWSEYKFHFMILCRSFALQGFLEDPAPWGNGYAFPVNEPALISEYIQYSTAVYYGILTSSTEVIRYKIKPFADGYYPAAETWKFLHKEYASEENLGQNDLMHQMQTLKMVPGQGEAYLAQKLRLRDQLYAINYPVTRISFNDFLVQGLPDKWETFKTIMRGQIRHISEEQMIAYIRDEDRHAEQKTNSDRMYAATSHPKGTMRMAQTSQYQRAEADRETLHCTHCNKQGHTAAKCWNKPPFYCPRCKAQGHTLQNCSQKGKQSTEPEAQSSEGEGKKAKKNRKKGKKKGEEQSLLMLSYPKPNDGKLIDYALQAKTAKQRSKSTGKHEIWIMDSGATSHMTPHAHYFQTIQRPETSRMVMTGSKELLQVSGIGNIRAVTSTGQPVVLTNVLLVPKLAASLMSLAKLLQAGLSCEGKGNQVWLYSNHLTYLTFGLKEKTPLRITDTSEQAMNYSYNVQEKEEETTLAWHKRLGHMSQSYMKHLVQHKLAQGVPLSKVHDFTCEDCQRGKITQEPYPKMAEKAPVKEKLALVHIDICGPFHASRHGYKYFATITDDATRYK